ncbi:MULTISPECIES: helix-turn-helix transcriptional regulator [unclassified Streptomyces]|uniref:helix-turn-helix domain-containing protein n=1 Tax=unclassified Streptomyces TaxID=2593676 RepID=UPI0008815C8E|nr:MULTISPECIES: helix-turn-helix transcriptional regulator [unclassified Streptomyces]PBC86714.1 helix-turn-helix protein [Streptomyces sp. 2321.6]SDQ74789.1 Helix-turn-helix domain-containing protein [Streptomyces sp. KS_16]SED48600.1 Helix-turn-helix domain-containing protein [Streptomyces sp. 2112.3]SEE07165.1 Helix-turn-helix domain-containing protein [Streptomyces sp. 2133.1]SNC73890.1 Helix-turn-helix domain-containing protein [Streptomyces sp. 2114.4]
MGAVEETSGVAALLKELKNRSGHSYGALAKRLHMSTSTLHRYCNGDAVPTEYAPLERLARLCRATPDELVELHRRWILADEARRRERDRKQAGRATAVVAVEGETVAGAEDGLGAGAGPESEPDTETEPETDTEPHSETGSGAGRGAGSGTAPVPPPAHPAAASASARVAETSAAGRPVTQVVSGGRRRRIALTAGIAVATVAVSASLAAGLVADGDGHGREAAAERTASAESGNGAVGAGGGRLPSASAQPPATGSTSSSPSPSPFLSLSPSRTAGGGEANGPDTDDRAGLPVSVDVRPYRWESPCSQRYLVDRDPGTMGPPPSEQDARGWISSLGAVSADSQLVEVSVQGTGDRTVVLHGLRVRVVSSAAPPAWNAYSMGVGCGGGITPKTFGVSLDAPQPSIAPQGGQRDFPYKVSERDPEVFKITAHAGVRAVRWYLQLEWSSGNRHGTLRIDDNGEPFHTSGMEGRPQYDYPLGGSKWIPAPKEDG